MILPLSIEKVFKEIQGNIKGRFLPSYSKFRGQVILRFSIV